MVERRWATTKVLLPTWAFSRAAWTSFSLLLSRALEFERKDIVKRNSKERERKERKGRKKEKGKEERKGEKEEKKKKKKKKKKRGGFETWWPRQGEGSEGS
jgi:hypothetical protein